MILKHHATIQHVIITVVSSFICSAGSGDESSRQLEFFESRIRPALVKHCYSCHSSESESVKGNLLLDSAGGWMTGGDSGPAIVRGQPDASLLIEALRYDGLEMPPDRKLPAVIIKDFEHWIKSGAIDPRTAPASKQNHTEIDIQKGRRFWAFQAVKDNPRPQTKTASQTAIDAFIYAQLEAAGISPNATTSADKLIRRLYVDLIGLAPTPAQQQSAMESYSSGSIAKVVDRLLNSRQFGVHWGRHWLDVARYADSNGGDFNATFHNAWRYRNYVVNAMNSDKPFNQFIREQIAGDLLPSKNDEQRAEQLIATGFLMIGTKMLSERDKDKLRMDVIDEQINTVGSSFLGLTLGCARCHDHKFDPIPTRDYYALAGIFQNTRTLEGESQKYVSTWTKISLPTNPQHIAQRQKWTSKKKTIQTELKDAEKHLKELQNHSTANDRFIVDDASAELTGQWKKSTLTPGFTGQGYIHDDKTGKGEKSVRFSWVVPKTAHYEVRLSYAPGGNRADNIPVQIRHSEGTTDVRVDQTKTPEHDQLFSTIGRFLFTKGIDATVTVSTARTEGYVIADAVRFVETGAKGQPVEQTSEGKEQGDSKSAQQKELVNRLKAELKELEKEAPEPLPMALAAAERSEIGNCRICIRGEHKNQGKEIPRGVLQIAAIDNHTFANSDKSGRLEIAEWIASARNPLTGRVIVNRIWSHLLGEGIVRSVDNFGKLGDRPSHPKLLDHLTTRFITPQNSTTPAGSPGLGWSVKSLIREIVLSNVYQRSSLHSEKAFSADPENRLFWKSNRRRLPAEALRDSMLLISGKLDLTPGDSPVKGLGTLVKSNNADAEDYIREESSRRSLYLPIIRNELPPVLTVFDFADPDLVVGKRSETNVPSQALFLMNSPFVMDCAEQTAIAICKNNQDTISQLVNATYKKVLARQPDQDEIIQAAKFLGHTGGTADPDQNQNATSEPLETRLARFIHMMFASTEFRMID